MTLHRAHAVLLAAQLLLASLAFGQSYKVENAGAPAAGQVPAAVQNALESQGAKVENGQGGTLLEVWFAKTVATNSSASPSSDFLYPSLTEGEFLGVLHFASPGADFRGQAIKPGFYTVRYGLIPTDGNHMGVNPTRDVLVLCPAAADTDLSANLKFDDLVKLSRQAAGTPHPAFLVGAPVNGSSFPAVAKDDQDHWNLQVKLHGSSGDLPFAFTVVGKWQG
ncbi:conserved exported hypothetical protein [Acidobacteriia bacterium SbA2]|nr:conserved exported hypothetical protein [Acidobacteriia bacterium SbA2]